MNGERTPVDDTERLMGHEYNGIREYDNPMPSWWVWSFIGSIVFCVPYLMYYHFGIGPSVEQEYEAEMGAFYDAQSALLGELEPDRATIVAYMGDRNMMLGMSSVFRANCVTCHGPGGRGGTGPNLTDDSYINIKVIEDLPIVIANGVDGRGMPSWSGKLTSNQVVLMAAYVASLRDGDSEGGSDPEGVVIPAWPVKTPAVAGDGGAESPVE